MRIDLDNTLQIIPFRQLRETDNFVNSFTDRKVKRNYLLDAPPIITKLGNMTMIEHQYEDEVLSQTTFPSSYNLLGNVYHQNYLEYLGLAYANHYGVVLTPDIFWYTILCELALIMVENPEKYRKLFTVSEGKINIVMEQEGNPDEIPLEQLITLLSHVIPTKLDIFLHTFSTSTDSSLSAQYAAFADMVSPYYSYSVKACGIPYIEFKGTSDDWISILTSLSHLSALFPGEENYFSKCVIIVTKLISYFNDTDVEYMKKIFYTERCGSGSDKNLLGWWTDLYRTQPQYNVRRLSNFPAHVSKVNFKYLPLTGDPQNYQLNSGLLSSTIDNNLLVPSFGSVTLIKKD